MREQMKALDDLEMGDLWAQALQRTPQPDPGPEPHRPSVRNRIVAAVVAIVVFVVAGVFTLNAFDDGQDSVSGSRLVPAAKCPASLPAGAIAVVTCEQGTDQAWGVAAFISAADGAEVSWREYPGSFEGQTIPSWVVTFSGAHFVEGSDGCSASGSLASYTVVVSALSGALVASDGPPEGCSVVQQIAPLVELPSDPCALVTSDQVAAATSSNVLSSRQLSDSDLTVPGPPYPCSFETDGRFGHVGVVSVPNDPQGFTDLLNKDPLNREIVSGVGDGAFISSGSEIVVALGDGYYTMGMQHGAGSEAESALRRLAEDALRSLQSGGSENGSPTPTPDGFFLAPHLAGGHGWDSVSSEPIPAAQRDGTTAWASTIPISQEDVHLQAAIPPSTIAQLPSDGIVVTVEVVPSAFRDDTVPFPYADLSFDLAAATRRGPEAEEPPGDYSVLQIENAAAATLVRVYFGARNPSPELVARAQSELDTLQLPPTCTAGGPGSYAVSVSSTTASSGDVLTLTGNVPFQREDGSFDESGNGQMVAWWNADPKDWPYLTSDLPTPSPAVEGQGILELGQASMDTCTFSIPFAVPQSAPGAYPVVVLQEGGGGATLEGSVTIHVTG